MGNLSPRAITITVSVKQVAEEVKVVVSKVRVEVK
jgi:hypothetical protein